MIIASFSFTLIPIGLLGSRSSLPREFDLHIFIDYDMQFDKAFVDPLKVVISLIGWNVEPVASLDSFFG